MIIKFFSSAVLFLQVLFFALLPYSYSTIVTDKKIVTIFNNFSTGLFLGISFLHIIPQANEKISDALGIDDHHSPEQPHEHHIPYGSLISILIFLCILAIQVYLHDGNYSDQYHSRKPTHHQMYETLSNDKYKRRRRLYLQTMLVQFALSTHSFFECLSIGIQNNQNIAYALAFAIIFHKWAQALTLGFSYYASGMNRDEALKFAIFHSCLNAGAVLIGIQLSSMSQLVNGIVNSISGGTFIYVCMIEKIGKNFQNNDELLTKMALILGGLAFSCLIML